MSQKAFAPNFADINFNQTEATSGPSSNQNFDVESINTSNIFKLEAEAAHVILEAVRSLRRIALMFSGGKDSACIAHIIRKLFSGLGGETASPIEFFHYDSGDNFQEVLNYRDRLASQIPASLTAFSVIDAFKVGHIKNSPDNEGSILALVELINYSQQISGVDGLIGGGRRDEDPIRAKERIFSLRGVNGKWQADAQRPEVWNLYNTRLNEGEHFRIFPLSNWTERSVWEYIARENIELPSIYYAHKRPVFERNGLILAYFEDIQLRPGELITEKIVRARTVGDRRTTAFVESSASTPKSVLAEVVTSRFSERAGRTEDKRAETSMEQRKIGGWF